MNHICKTYIEFLYSDPFFSGSSVQEVKTRDPLQVKVPKNAFGFRFFDILFMVVDADSTQVQLTSEQINWSPTHYCGGKLYTVAELNRDFPNKRALISLIEQNDIPYAIHCHTGDWQLFRKTDVFIETVA